MGHVKRLLFQGTLPKTSDLYGDTRSIEAAESMHIHERNVRLEYTTTEFKRLLESMNSAGRAWQGRLSETTQWLDVTSIGAPGVTPHRFEIEESEYPTFTETTIHLHYRNLRLEFTHAEWEQFAAAVQQAWKEWK